MKIRLTAGVVRENLPKLVAMIQEAQQFRDDQILGYASWTAYVADVFSDEPLRLPREERQELVAILAGEGMSTRAIAPIVGVSKSQVAADIEVSSSGHVPPALTDEPGHVTKLTGAGSVAAVNVTPTLAPRMDDWVQPGEVVDTATGEVTDVPVTVTETHTVKTVTGLDGKTYSAKPRKPKPVLAGDAAAQDAADQMAIHFGRALVNLAGLMVPARRAVVIADWPRGRDAATPDAQELATPETFRAIAVALDQLADEWENTNV